MEKFCRPPLRKGEIVTVVQGLFDGLAPGQALARKMLFEHDVMPWEEATAFLQKIGPDVSAKFLLLEPKDLQMACLEMQFVTGEPALQSQYVS